MADLSAYVDFTLTLDKSGTAPLALVTDTYTGLPTGTTVTGGIFTVTQPDGLTTSFTDGAPITLRLAADGSFQQGQYLFTRTLKATGYDDTIIHKTYSINYTPVRVSITPLIDVFTPNIQLLDSTIYDVAGFNSPAVSRAWSGTVSYAGTAAPTLTSTDPVLDYGINGAYYDAGYDAVFSVSLSYVSRSAPWVTLKDTRAAHFTFDVFTPPALAALRTGIAHLQTKHACGNCDTSAFLKAQSLYDLFTASGRGGDLLATTYAYIPQLQRLLHCGHYSLPTHTYAPIPPYNWESGSAGGGGSHDTIQFTVGSGLQYVPNDGDSEYINPTLKGIRPKGIYLQSVADFLTPDQWANRPLGGFRLLGGLTFNAGDKYTLTFEAVSGGGSGGGGSVNPFELVLTDPATGKQIRITANTTDDTNPTVNFSFV